jgi:hypothetical protein
MPQGGSRSGKARPIGTNQALKPEVAKKVLINRRYNPPRNRRVGVPVQGVARTVGRTSSNLKRHEMEGTSSTMTETGRILGFSMRLTLVPNLEFR